MSELDQDSPLLNVELAAGGMMKLPVLNTLDAESKDFDRRLYQCIAHNLRLAREIAGISRGDAQNQIWNYKNKDAAPNRVSEMESGTKKIELRSVYKACVVYGCSPEFIFGFSDEFELHNLESQMAGLVFRSVRESVLEATSAICEGMSKSIKHLPPYQGELLRNSAQKCVEVALKYSHNMVFRAEYPDLLEALHDLQDKSIGFDRYFARQMRQIELVMESLLDNDEDENSTRKLTKHVDLKATKKI